MKRRLDVATLDEYLAACRRLGWSFERIASEIAVVTGGDVHVSATTIRSWIAEHDENGGAT